MRHSGSSLTLEDDSGGASGGPPCTLLTSSVNGKEAIAGAPVAASGRNENPVDDHKPPTQIGRDDDAVAEETAGASLESVAAAAEEVSSSPLRKCPTDFGERKGVGTAGAAAHSRVAADTLAPSRAGAGACSTSAGPHVACLLAGAAPSAATSASKSKVQAESETGERLELLDSSLKRDDRGTCCGGARRSANGMVAQANSSPEGLMDSTRSSC